MDNGWIKLHRKLLDSEIFASQIGLKIWLWSLMKASHKKRFIPIRIGKGETTVAVEKGSFIFGRNSASRELNINGSTVYKWMQKLQDMGMISIESNNQYSIITICNYVDYQKNEKDEVTAIEQPLDNQVTATQQPRDTYKKVKNVEKVKNIIKKEPINPISDLRDKFELSLDWAGLLNDWLEYKKAKGQTYKSDRSIKSFITKLRNLSNSDWFIAKQIVEDSMANNWAGIFKLKNNENNGNNGITAKQQQRHKVAGDVYQDLLSNVFSENDK